MLDIWKAYLFPRPFPRVRFSLTGLVSPLGGEVSDSPVGGSGTLPEFSIHNCPAPSQDA